MRVTDFPGPSSTSVMRHSLLEWHEITDIRVESSLQSSPIVPGLVVEIALADQRVDFTRVQLDRDALHAISTTLSIAILTMETTETAKSGKPRNTKGTTRWQTP